MGLLNTFLGIYVISGSDVRCCSVEQQIEFIVSSFEIDNNLDDLWIKLLSVTFWDGVD